MIKTSRTLQNGYKFFVLRRKLSNSESTEKYEDVFCVVPDSNIPINLTSNDASKEWHYDPNIKKEFNLQLFREYLMTFFNVNLDSNIFYMDENNKVHQVRMESEFLQLWKLAKTYAKHNRGVLLLIDFTNDLDNDTSENIIPIAGDGSFALGNKLLCSRACQSDGTITEFKKSNDRRYIREYKNRIFHLVDEKSNNLLQSMNNTSISLDNVNKSSSKILANTENVNDLTLRMGDVEVESTVPSFINSQDFKNDVPPTWFVNYMEQLKKVIVKEVLDQVMANKMENLNMCVTRSPMDAQGECIFPFNSCPRNHQNGTIESMQTIKDVKPGTVIKNDTINKSNSASSELAKHQLCVTEHMYESNIPKENDCRTKYCPSKYQTDDFGFKSKTCWCDEIENINITSDIDNREGVFNEDSFEIIPESSNNESSCDYITKKSIIKNITPFFKRRNQNRNIQNCANVESSMKELLPLSSSICIDENHFTACSNNIPTSSNNIDFNILSTHESDENNLTVYKDDNQKILQKHVSNKSINDNVAEFSKHIAKSLVNRSSKIEVLNPETESSENTSSTAESSVDIKGKHSSTNHDYSKHNLIYSSKPTNTKENRMHKQTSDNLTYGNPEKKLSKEESNATYWSVFEDSSANSTAENAEPVRILPETLVTGAVHLASFAYGTALEAITKIRSNSKDD